MEMHTWAYHQWSDETEPRLNVDLDRVLVLLRNFKDLKQVFLKGWPIRPHWEGQALAEANRALNWENGWLREGTQIVLEYRAM